ncbi:hypothetical protein B0I72DRAFT_134459 [Yarrowia lipolytica]|uniref:Secreted protein n=1 Tax=Yarrowia lipolytica TaxID=4952 RepID=A0A371C9I1_YARLL|nr:hypothetical protein B0I71DRAFT_129966 [Yarrowia lipolytica]RDW34619.1 hypothetical protein B0I72DRAFT_134459 [Yarrowia lipolytica]RDW40181.1 hypothetical protein B0I73DRAFT_130829 [Yarrowia lipolytica]RDW43747.1 hypothetical protein B0I74DRAFT_141543 [Yarrowia lipolytica]RDW50471.1 hypothetical protein B0I75DRAFT_141437 [Yarrowia lipolytica]
MMVLFASFLACFFPLLLRLFRSSFCSPTSYNPNSRPEQDTRNMHQRSRGSLYHYPSSLATDVDAKHGHGLTAGYRYPVGEVHCCPAT